MAKKRKKKPPANANEPQGQMRPEGAPERPEGTRIDDGARHAFFSFKGELKGDLPDATETDYAGNLGLPAQAKDETSTTDPSASQDADATPTDLSAVAPRGAEADAADTQVDRSEAASQESSDDATRTPLEPADSSAEAPLGAKADADLTAAETNADPVSGARDQEQSRAGPVRGQDPAAQKTASQSRKAAGPAHFIPPHESPPGDSGAEEPAIAPLGATAGRIERPAAAPEPTASAEEPSTHTDVRGEPFVPAADMTHTEIDAGIFRGPPEPKEATQTEFDAWPRPATPGDEAPAPSTQTDVRAEPFRGAPPEPRKVTSVGDESSAGSETMLDVEGARGPGDLARRKPGAPAAAKPTAVEDGTATGSETVLDAGEAREPDDATLTGPAAMPSAEILVRALPREAGPDADTVTKEPGATATRVTATDIARDEASAPEAPSFHDAETDSQPFHEIAGEATLPPPVAFDAPLDEATTDPLAEPTDVLAPFAGPLFDAPAPSVEMAPEPSGPKAPRRRRRSERKQREPALKRVVRWAKRRLDPRDFLEIVGKALFERAGKLGEKVRTARRENRVAHTAGWWRQTLLEIAILYAIVIPIELAVSGGRLGSFGVHPHPYWLVVLPLAAARGLVAGLLAAGIAAALCTIGAAQAVNDALFTFRNMTEPLLFFAVAFFAGELHDEGLLKRKKLDRRVKDLEERTEQLRKQRDVLTDANRELEKRIVDDSVQFGNLIQAARRIERAGRQEVFDLALEMAEEHCGAAASVLILLDDQSLDYLCHRGWPSEEIGRRLGIARESTFVKRAVAEGVAVNGLDPSEVAPQEGPLVVAPLFDAGGVVKAIICLDEIPLARLNESTVTVFLGISDWASAALARLTRGGDAPAPRAAALSVGPEVDLWLGSVSDLGRRLRIELARCSRYGVPTSFLTIQATEWKDATRDGIDALDRFVLLHFTTGLRPSDGIFRFGYPGAYLLVLAGTSREGAEVVRTRLERRISYTPSPVGTIEILATGPDSEAPDLVSLVSRVAQGFRDRSKLPLDARCPVAFADRIDAEDLNAFLRRLKMETSLAVRNGFDLHVVGISAEASEKAGPGILARHVVEVGEQTLRPTDGVYMIGQYQCSIILPCTNGEEAATVAHRLATLVRARDPSAPYGQIETQVLGLGPSHPDAGSFLTALARRGKEASR